MNSEFYSEVGKELRRLNLEKSKIDKSHKTWTKELLEEHKMLKIKIKLLKDVVKYFDPLDDIFVNCVNPVVEEGQ